MQTIIQNGGIVIDSDVATYRLKGLVQLHGTGIMRFDFLMILSSRLLLVQYPRKVVIDSGVTRREFLCHFERRDRVLKETLSMLEKRVQVLDRGRGFRGASSHLRLDQYSKRLVNVPKSHSQILPSFAIHWCRLDCQMLIFGATKGRRQRFPHYWIPTVLQVLDLAFFTLRPCRRFETSRLF